MSKQEYSRRIRFLFMTGKRVCQFVMLALILVIIGLPQKVQAEEDLTIPMWKVNAELLENGDLEIVEDLTFDFKDKFNGVFREISQNKTSGIAAIQVQELRSDTAIDYTQVKKAAKGDSEVFLAKEKNDKVIIQIFSPSKDQQRIFRIRYLIKNVAIKYKDTGELYYQFLGKENKTPIKKFYVNIKLPKGTAEDRIEVFAHGPLNGTIENKKSHTYTLSVTNVPADTFVEGRILFPTEYIPRSENVQNKDRYQSIIEEEEAYQKKQVEDQQRKEAIGTVLEKVTFLLSGLGAVILVFSLVKYKREENVYQSENFTGIPEECTPAVAGHLTGTYVDTNTIFASILDLCRKGYLRIDGEQEEVGTGKKKQNFYITRLKETDEHLLRHEEYLCRWLLDEIGDGETVSNKDIERFSRKNSSRFTASFAIWQKKIKEDAIQKGYYDKSKTKLGVFFLLSAVVLCGIGISTILYGSLSGLVGIISAIVLSICSLNFFYRLSDYGYSQYKKWMLFKKRMKKYNLEQPLGERNDSMDRSLIYALGLGVVKKPAHFDERRIDQYEEIYSTNGWMLWYLLFVSNNNNSFHRSMDYAFSEISSSASGGSFSGGGGGGAGGGGAGGF